MSFSIWTVGDQQLWTGYCKRTACRTRITILCTSPDKHQILWSVEGFEKEQVESLVRAMAKRFEADQAVGDVARVHLLPGFRNHTSFVTL